ncbi:MAG: DNA-binding domain-containing protein [Polyangiaceae bacterium]
MTDELERLQRWIVEQLRSERGLPKSPVVSAEAARHLTGNSRLSPVEQLEIYRVQFWLRHTTSLVEDFPGVGGILGQEEWQRLVEGYLARHPPETWTLRDLGRHFPEHIAQAPDLSHRALCQDMARLEWHYVELFDAAEVAPFDASVLGALTPEAIERARFDFGPALSLAHFHYPVADLRLALLDHTRSDSARGSGTPRSNDGVPIPDMQPQHLVLYRGTNRRLYHHPVSKAAFVLLQQLTRGRSLLEACEDTLERLPDAGDELAAGVGAWFQDWVKRGWIKSLRTEPGSP